MKHNEIVSKLQCRDPSEIIYSVTMLGVLKAIVFRLGEDALDLTTADFDLARDEVKAAFDHNLDEREYIDMGLDAWEITRKL